MLLPRKPRPPAAPSAQLLVRGVTVDRDHLATYARVCGFPVSDALPPTYPHVLGFGLALTLMTRDDFPFPLAGLVHTENAIEHHRPVTADEPLDIAVRAERFTRHERGHTIDVLTTATVDDTVAWHERSTYLRRSGSAQPKAGTRSEGPTPTSTWRVGREVGRAYARVSGDRNPIHTSWVGARLFGFPRPIAHGMWTLARCLAALAGRLPDAYTVDVAFKRPVLLPSTLAFSAAEVPKGWTFELHDTAGSPKLRGTVTTG
jgi:acyl dehydratase